MLVQTRHLPGLIVAIAFVPLLAMGQDSGTAAVAKAGTTNTSTGNVFFEIPNAKVGDNFYLYKQGKTLAKLEVVSVVGSFAAVAKVIPHNAAPLINKGDAIYSIPAPEEMALTPLPTQAMAPAETPSGTLPAPTSSIPTFDQLLNAVPAATPAPSPTSPLAPLSTVIEKPAPTATATPPPFIAPAATPGPMPTPTPPPFIAPAPAGLPTPAPTPTPTPTPPPFFAPAPAPTAQPTPNP